MQYDYRQFIYFVDCAKALHNVRKIELFNLMYGVPRGDEQKLKEFIKEHLTV